MNSLEDAWTRLEQEFYERSTLDTLGICRAIRTYLQRPDPRASEERIEVWCRRVFASPLPLDDVLLLAWQVLYRGAPSVAPRLADDERVVMRLGRVRAELIYGHFDGDQEIEGAGRYLEGVVRAGGLGTVLATTVLEIAERLTASFPERIASVGEAFLVVLEELVCHKDDLVLHRIRALVLALYRVFRTEDPSRQRLDAIVRGIEADVKMRYLLLKDLLEADIQVPGLTNPTTLSPLVDIIMANKSIAPAVSDCVVGFMKMRMLPLEVTSDPNGFLGTFLFPRMVKRLERTRIVALLETLRGNAQCGDEEGLILYFSLVAAILGGEFGVPALDERLVEIGLGAHGEMLRNRAFSCLCRSVTMESSFSPQLQHLIYTFIFDAQLGTGSDTRQQIVAAMKHLVDVHISRLYKLLREELRSPRPEPPLERAQSEEIQSIVGFWVRIVTLCALSLCKTGFFAKNDLSLKLLQCIVAVWREKLQKCIEVKPMHASLKILYDQITIPMVRSDFMERMCQCVVHNSFDTIREEAANLIRSLGYPLQGPFMEEGDGGGEAYFEGQILPLLASRRAHLLDGAAKLLTLYCEAHGNHAMVFRRLAGLLEEAVHALDPDNAESYSKSGALGLLIASRSIVDGADVADVERVAKLCIAVGGAVNEYISLASPEGHQFGGPHGEGEDADEDDDEGDAGDHSFAVMTFCWRATKEFSKLLVACWRRQGSRLCPDVPGDSCRFLTETLLNARHPGAFISLSHSLREICKLCYSSGEEKVATLPRTLLLDTLRSCRERPEVQTTRRSAGIPFCIAAIITASSSAVQRTMLLGETMDFLFALLADPEGFTTPNPKPSVVHTLNVLRLLYRESTLAEEAVPHLASGFALCFCAFGSPNWSVRNSGLMLFTALMNRTFGVRHDVDDFAPLNLLDVRVLHAKSSTILSLIVLQCRRSLDLLRSTDRPESRYRIEFSVYPLLSFIQRLRFSPGGEHRHLEFYQVAMEYVWQCLGNDIMKVRHMAARLLCHMSQSPSLAADLAIRVRAARTLETSAASANRLHGLAFLSRLLRRHPARLVAAADVEQLRDWLVALEAGRCYPIRLLLEEEEEEEKEEKEEKEVKSSGPVKKDIRQQYSLEQMRLMLRHRHLSASMVAQVMPVLVEYALNQTDDFADSLFAIFESFWTQYDLAGLYRLNLAKAWRLTGRAEHPAAIRIRYLALTDEDEAVRDMASGPSFSATPSSVPRALRVLLRAHSESVSDLIDFVPCGDPRALASGRKALFEAEPLNGFKDPAWERQALQESF